MSTKTKSSVVNTIIIIGFIFALALSAFAQKAPQQGTNITVSKGGGGMFATIQAAVNAARTGDVIEILDTAVYEEQVTIYGSSPYHPDGSPWPNVTGGKYGITIRYAPVPGSNARPVITYHDVTNRSPKNSIEAGNLGYLPNSSANWETCAAVRVIGTSGITIEGIIIDGGGSAPFQNPGVWGTEPLLHGNAAVSLSVTGDVQIRDCEIRNAFIGIYVKDRNTGGVFANRNPDDRDYTLPLSGFGKSGNHLFEYNKIGGNEIGVFFESSWDLGSTIRHNLIYRNINRGSLVENPSQDLVAGGIKFKENYLAPAAIYNNTFFENTKGIFGTWQVGYQHMIFNNIFSKPNAVGGEHPAPHLSLEIKFIERLKHNVFAADMALATAGEPNCPYAGMVQFRQLLSPAASSVTLQCGDGQTVQAVVPGSGLPGFYDVRGGSDGQPIMSRYYFPAGANNRWLETAGGTTSSGPPLPSMFESLDPAHPDFLVPKWSMPEVEEFIRNAGWDASGIINDDGTTADLGAIPFSGKRPMDGMPQTTRARIKPTDVVTVNGTQATAKFFVSQEIASESLTGLEIKYIRWVAPLPDNRNAYGAGNNIDPGVSLTSEMIKEVVIPPSTVIVPGSNEVTFTIPQLPPPPAGFENYGFFELVIGGRDAVGRPIATNVGFLPYRQLNQYFDVQAFKDGEPVTEVTAGEPVTIRVTAMDRITGAAFTRGGNARALEAAFSLLSSPTARMYTTADQSLAHDGDVKTDGAYREEYTVFFTDAGNEVVSVAGSWCDAATCAAATPENRLAFLGNLRLTVKPRVVDGVEAPAQIVFTSPASGGEAVIKGFYHVSVQVRDSFGNPVTTPVRVDIRSTAPEVGSVAPEFVMTDPQTGNADFVAQTAPDALAGASFKLIATMEVGGAVFADTVTLKLEADLPPPEERVPAPRVVSGGYNSAGGYIHTTRLIFDRNASRDWFENFVFAFGPTRGTMANPYCVWLEQENEKTILVNMGCGFPGANLDESRGNSSRITINYNSTMGWAPQTVNIASGEVVSIKERDRVIPVNNNDNGVAVVVPPVNVSSFEVSVGPNPIRKSDGSESVNIFITGKRIDRGELMIYDATGNAVKKINIRDNVIGNNGGRRIIGQWDLRDAKGRPVVEGTYLLRGVVKTVDGRREKVSIIIGVR